MKVVDELQKLEEISNKCNQRFSFFCNSTIKQLYITLGQKNLLKQSNVDWTL